MSVRKLTVWAFISLALLFAIVGSWTIRTYLATPLAIPDQGYRLEIRSGTPWSAIAERLVDDGLTRWGPLLTLYGRLTGQAGRIQAGTYNLAPGLTPASLLAELVSGRVEQHRLTLVEGWTVEEVLRTIGTVPTLRKTLQASDAKSLAVELKLPWASAEGAFYPETYLFTGGTTDRELLMRAHAELVAHLQRAWENRAPEAPLANSYELLILASIVEKETAKASERPLIAGVFARRLERGMRLQTDPTVIYGLGRSFDGNLTRRQLETDSPWNTYTRVGLPPTPIAAPSGAAIEASANPAEGTAIFFVATGDGDGSHRFSDTLAQHEAAVRVYLRKLRQRDAK